MPTLRATNFSCSTPPSSKNPAGIQVLKTVWLGYCHVLTNVKFINIQRYLHRWYPEVEFKTDWIIELVNRRLQCCRIDTSSKKGRQVVCCKTKHVQQNHCQWAYKQIWKGSASKMLNKMLDWKMKLALNKARRSQTKLFVIHVSSGSSRPPATYLKRNTFWRFTASFMLLKVTKLLCYTGNFCCWAVFTDICWSTWTVRNSLVCLLIVYQRWLRERNKVSALSQICKDELAPENLTQIPFHAHACVDTFVFICS
jgi:hypothetical protein